MPSPLKLLAAVTVFLLALGGAGSARASSTRVVAPGHLQAQTIPVVASGVCWTGSVTFAPAQPFGNPQTYHKVVVAGVTGAFTKCIGQYADVSVNAGGSQTDLARSYQLASTDTSGFTVLLSKGTLPVPVPAGTFYTLVIHP